MNITNVTRHTVVPMKFCLLKRNDKKIMLKAVMANIVVYGYHFTRNPGLPMYCLRSFNCAEQILIHNNKTVNPGMAIR